MAVDDADAAGVDHLDPALRRSGVSPAAPGTEMRSRVTPAVGSTIDDAAAAHAVEQRRLADVGAADDRDARQLGSVLGGHGIR